MANFYEYDNALGLVIPQTSDLKEQTQEEYKAAFGQDLSLVDSTPQGVLIENETALKRTVLNAIANIVNGMNVRYAQGRQLDAIGETYSVPRRLQQPSLVQATIYGVPNTLIPEGSLAETIEGHKFQSASTVTIGSTGETIVFFQSVEGGEIPCPVNHLTVVIGNADGTEIRGWERINNTSAATLGYVEESDLSYRQRIMKSLQKAPGYLESFASELSQVNGLIDSFVKDNYEQTTQIYEGLPIDPKSVVVIANGGLNQDVLQAIFNAKDAGCGYTALNGTYAFGQIAYTENFTDGDTIKIGSTTLTAGTDFDVEDTLQQTLENVAALEVDDVVLAVNPTNTILDITADTIGTAGNSITIESSNGITTGETLTGGNSVDQSFEGYVREPVSGIYYKVIANRPVYVPFSTTIVARTNKYAGTDLKGEIETSVMNWAADNLSEVEGLSIGNNVNSYEIASAITSQIPDCQVVSVLLGDATGQQAYGSIQFTSNLENGDTITIGSTILTAGVDFEISRVLPQTLIYLASVSVKDFNLSATDDELIVQYKYAGTEGNGKPLDTSISTAQVTAMAHGTNNPTAIQTNINIGRNSCGSLSVANVKVIVL